MAVNCRGRFSYPEKIQTSASRKPVDIHYISWQIAAVAVFLILKNYTIQLVESLATNTIFVGNLRLLNNLLLPDKIPTSPGGNHATFFVLIIYYNLTQYLLPRAKARRLL